MVRRSVPSSALAIAVAVSGALARAEVRHQWAIFNEDQSDMPIGASFNVLVAPEPALGLAPAALAALLAVARATKRRRVR
jgi:hypothetical protein